MIYALVAALLLLLGALWFAFSKGKRAAQYHAEIVRLRQWNIVQGKAIHALGKAIEMEADLKKLSDRIQNASDVDQLRRLYDEITAPDPGTTS